MNDFWTTFVAQVEHADDRSPLDWVNQLRAVAKESLKPSNDLFSTAWAAHSLVEQGSFQTLTKVPWKLKIATLLLLEACCQQFVENMALSPFFPLLIHDSLAVLRLADNNQMLHACVMDLVESFLPDMLQDKYPLVEQAIASGTVDISILNLLQDSVDEWTSKYQDDSYVTPVVFAWKDSEITDLKRLLDRSEMVDPSKLLEPQASVQLPFARPLPPPLLPLMGYDADEQALTDEEAAQVLEYLHAELIWLTPTNLRLMLLPDDESDDREANERYRKVLELVQAQAFRKPLAPNDQHTVMQLLSGKNDDSESAIRLIQESGLTPQTLPRLVEHNPLVAYECLLRILHSSTDNDKNEYLSALVSMDMSLHSMEVVNRLATYNLGNDDDDERLLHPEYIHLFINSCIATCETIPEVHAQNRLVRLVCVFIQSLLRHNIVHVDDIYFEVQAFCVEFSRIREASALYKSLKEV